MTMLAQSTSAVPSPARSQSLPRVAPAPRRSSSVAAGTRSPVASPGPQTSTKPLPAPGTATAASSPVISPQDAVLGWTWTVLFVVATVAAIVYAGRYIESVYSASAARRKKNGGLPPLDEPAQRRRRANIVIFVLIGMVMLGLVWVPMVPQLHGQRWVAIEVASVGILLAGAFAGFLFGLPRLTDWQAQPAPAGTTAPPTSLYRPSTNLEQVVDRIATLLAGIALAQIVAIPAYIATFAKFIGDDLEGGTVPSAQILATGILLYFAPLGFILSFLCTKTIVAPELAHADEDLVGFERSKTVIDDTLVLPDASVDLTPEQKAAVQRVAAAPLTSLTTAAQKATWGRAQLLLNNLDNAILALQQAQALTPYDPQVLADLAQALYSQNSVNAPMAQQLAAQGEMHAPADDDKLLARLRNLQAVCALYISGGYEQTISIVNATLADPRLALGERLRFYRACAFGQMWRAIDSAAPPPADAQARLDAIAEQIVRDTRISLAYPGLRAQFTLVTVPDGRADGSQDDDLQAFGQQNAVFRALLGITQPIPDPTTPVPPQPIADPIQTIQNSPT